MKYDTTLPIYMQIMDRIKKDVVTGVLKSGEKIDSVRALSEIYDVNLNTMHHACSELERQGVIHAQRGVGNFVTADPLMVETIKKEMSDQLVNKFLTGMKDIGYDENDIFEVLKRELKK